MDTDLYFSPDYRTARRRFKQAAARVGAKLETLEWGLRGPGGEKLGIDIAYIGNKRAKRVLLHSSGIHGVEGFAGSAIQLRVLENLPERPKDGAYVFVHILNPYGMAHLRRVNENNVDLNRNFLDSEADYAGAARGYHILNPLFNPESPPSFDFFYLRLAWKLFRYGVRRLRQAGAEGQYEYPQGLFFGGKRLEKGPHLYLEWIRENLKGSKRLCCVDVHTGLGRSGEQLVILERNQGGSYHKFLEPIYGEELDNTEPERAIVYQVRGGVDYGVPKALPAKAEVDFVTQEFGTVHGFEILSTLRQENRLTHYGNPSPLHPVKLAIKDAFSPPRTDWKRKIITKGEKLFHDTVAFLFAE